MSPTILRVGKYRLFFYSNEEDRPHIHVKADSNEAKFWIGRCAELVENYGFTSREISEISNIVTENNAYLLDKWRDIRG